MVICPCTVPGCYRKHCIKERLPGTFSCVLMRPVFVSEAGLGRDAPCCTAGKSLASGPSWHSQAPRPHIGAVRQVMKLKQANYIQAVLCSIYCIFFIIMFCYT